MPAPRGNKNAVGNRGGARKSAYQEHADAVMLEQMFLQEMSKEEVQKKLASGKYSLKEVFVSKAFAGNERMLIALFSKLFPDQSNLILSMVKPLPTDKADSKLKKLYGISKLRNNRGDKEDEPRGQIDNN